MKYKKNIIKNDFILLLIIPHYLKYLFTFKYNLLKNIILNNESIGNIGIRYLLCVSGTQLV